MTRELTFILAESAYNELQDLSWRSRRSMTEIVSDGIGLVKIAVEAHRNKQRMMLVDENNRAVKEIPIPGLRFKP